MPLPGRAQSAGDRVPEWQENSGHGDVFCWGLVRALALQRDNSSGLYPSVRESLMEESAMTRVGSSWVFGKEAAPGAAMGCGSWATLTLFTCD